MHTRAPMHRHTSTHPHKKTYPTHDNTTSQGLSKMDTSHGRKFTARQHYKTKWTHREAIYPLISSFCPGERWPANEIDLTIEKIFLIQGANFDLQEEVQWIPHRAFTIMSSLIVDLQATSKKQLPGGKCKGEQNTRSNCYLTISLTSGADHLTGMRPPADL